MQSLTVIIPTLDEESEIAEAVASASAGGADEVIVVDGGSGDGTRKVAAAAGARVLRGPRGRGSQLRVGVAAATGEVVLCLHADSRLPIGARAAIDRVVARGAVGGAFLLRFRESGRALSLVARGINLRTRAGFPCTGDQAQFFRRAALERVGGVPDVPFLEDLILWRRLRRIGPMGIASETVETSGRRFLQGGPVRTLLGMWRIRLLHRVGVPPRRLARRYAVPAPR